MENYVIMITIKPKILFGKPCITGTRIAVEDILAWLASGMSYKEITDEYPVLNRQQILAALNFAVRREQFVRILVA